MVAMFDNLGTHKSNGTMKILNGRRIQQQKEMMTTHVGDYFFGSVPNVFS
jgi:hypothetical protein